MLRKRKEGRKGGRKQEEIAGLQQSQDTNITDDKLFRQSEIYSMDQMEYPASKSSPSLMG